MIYALIKNGIIFNMIVLDDPSLVYLWETDGVSVIRTDNINPQPCIGWLYQDGNFIDPSV